MNAKACSVKGFHGHQGVSAITAAVLGVAICLLISPAATARSKAAAPPPSGWQVKGTALRDDVKAVTYAGTAALAFAGTNTLGVFKSTDGGFNWTQTALDGTVLNGATVNSIVASIQYGTSPLLVAGTSAGEVYTSTNDGANWTLATGLPGSAVNRVQVNPFYSSIPDIFAATDGGGVYKSVDGGATFTVLPSMPAGATGKVTDLAFGYSYASTKFLWVCTDSSTTTSADAGVYRFDGNAGTWTTHTPTPNPPTVGAAYRFNAIAASPDPAYPFVWVGDKTHGLSQYNGSAWTNYCSIPGNVVSIGVPPNFNGLMPRVIFGSGRGYFNFTPSNLCTPFGAMGVTGNGLAFSPADWGGAGDGTLLEATSAGIRIKRPGDVPRPPSVDQMDQFDMSALCVSPNIINDHWVFCASKRYGAFLSRNSGVSARRVAPGSVFGPAATGGVPSITAIAISPQFDGAMGACATPQTTMFIGTDGAGVFSSSDSGATLGQMIGLPAGARVSALALSPAFPTEQSLFAGLTSSPTVYRHTLAGGWNGGVILSGPSKITVLATLPNFNGAGIQGIYAGTDNGLFFSGNGGGTWNPVSNGFPPNQWITGIVADPGYDGVTRRTVFVSCSGAGVYKTPDGGNTWSYASFGSGLGVMALAISPNFGTDQTVVAGTNGQGVYLTNNGAGPSPIWLQANGMGSLTDLRVKALAIGQNGRIFCGVKDKKLFYSDNPQVLWTATTGFNTGSSVISTTIPGPVTPLTSITNSDLFAGGPDGVMWSDDGGETFRDINQRNIVYTTGQTCAFSVKCLYAFMAGVTPRLLAGTEGQGIWGRDAVFDNASGEWDWSQGQWQATNISSGTINHFSRETGITPLKIRAAGASGGRFAWTSTDGITWTPTDAGLPGPLTDVRHGVTTPPVASPGKDITAICPIPKAPSGSSVWGTVLNSGAYHGTDNGLFATRDEAVTWEIRNGAGVGSLSDLTGQVILQLSDETVLYGTQSTGVYRTTDKGLSFWDSSSAGIESTSKDIRDFLESTNGDVLCAVNGASGNGGVFLSGDLGRHWISISDGFDATEQTLTSLAVGSGDPPTYYAGTYSQGSYSRTITALPFPTVTSVVASSGASNGGTTVTITGTGFQNSCPTGYSCTNTSAVVSFGGIDASTTFVSDTSLTAVTPPHAGGTVAVSVRNPDTRMGVLGSAFAYTENETGPSITLSRNGPNQEVVITWSGAPNGAPTVFRSPKADFSVQVKADGGTGTSGSFTYADTTGTNAFLYFYKVE